jgi:chromosome segregation ATPase
MSSDLSESAADLGQDPQLRCLALAEKIISALNDESLVDRYFKVKSKLIGDRAYVPPPSPGQSDEITTDRAYSFYQSLAQENQRLKDEIATLSSRKPDFSAAPENESIAAQLRDLQRKILPEQKLPPRGDAVRELDVLRKVVDAKLDSLTFLRDNLRAHNQRLTNDYRELERQSNLKIAAAREREESERKEIEDAEQKLSVEYGSIQRQLEEVADQLRIAKDENGRLRQKHSETATLLEKIKAGYQETEQHIDAIENESEGIVDEIEMLKTEVSKKTKELRNLQTLQKYGVDVAGDFEISEEIQRLTQRAEALRSQNTQLGFELKRLEKRQHSGSVVATPDAISLDEDELAAQILKAKWH